MSLTKISIRKEEENLKKKKKIASALLALAMIMALSVSAFADNEITSPLSSATAPVLLTTEGTAFSATVPTALPVSVSSNGTVLCASDLTIQNHSCAQIKVSSVSVSGYGAWELKEFSTDFSREKTDLSHFAFKLQGAEVPTSGTADVSVFSPIDGGGQCALAYDAKIANQSAALSAVHIADVVFVLGWNT